MTKKQKPTCVHVYHHHKPDHRSILCRKYEFKHRSYEFVFHRRDSTHDDQSVLDHQREQHLENPWHHHTDEFDDDPN